MKIWHKPQPQTLSEWLEIATRRIEPSAQSRIRTEIEAHFAEAWEFQLKNGLSETEAQVTALADLGDPKAAGRRFCSEHLTVWEARRMAVSTKDARSRWGLVCRPLFLFLFGFYAVADQTVIQLPSNFWAEWMIFQFLVVIACGFAAFVPRERKMTLAEQRRILWVESVNWLNAAIFLTVWISVELPPLPATALTFLMKIGIWSLMACFLTVSLGTSLACLRIMSKLSLYMDNEGKKTD